MKRTSKIAQVSGLALLLGITGCSNVPTQNFCKSYQVKRDLEQIGQENGIGIHVEKISCNNYSIGYDSNGDGRGGDPIPNYIKPEYDKLVNNYLNEQKKIETRKVRNSFINI